MTSLRELFLAGLCILALVLAAGCTQPANEMDRTDAYTLSITKTATGAAPVLSPTPATTVSMEAWKRARLETSMGNITIALDPDMPITAGNFETLVQKGYYNGIIFHRVIDRFMIQGGDPAGTGHGGPGYTIKDEFTSHNKNSRGAVAMANTGQPNSGGSQFFINLVDNSPLQSNTFNSNYPVFGNVVEGMDVVDAIGKVQTSGYPADRPIQNITIIRAVMV